MAKSLSRQFKDIERKLNKELDKTVRNVNRKQARNPIELPIQTNYSDSGITVQNVHNDHRINVEGDVTHSQVGGHDNTLVIFSDEEVQKLLEEIRTLSITMSKTDREKLVKVLEELQGKGNVSSVENQIFLEKHPLITLGIGSIVSWATTAGLDKISSIIAKVFS
ncbi:hypothetical protein FEZ48_10340 [Marinilactibacillus psychrotolerans]|uniref:Uncharacterized protein n=2 Tax=Marinilactibacillus psychrotolerans TaxID=191770 RepID=A0A5R9C0T3_9LACT|nr:hypothetical protein [Marinilactibacillus psychrotolerans]TLQ06284.1 hypothetical protein FEZ48_10340 [Marinilactibacillus psychrotolerans]SJN19022.1 Unknown [Marinilactibacillus psychrotolerans 42ea]